MSIKRASPLNELYAAVADADLVITPDAALADAINRRLDRPHFGTFATTPRRFVANRREKAEDRTAFLEVIERVDHDWKAISYAVGNVLQCWEHQGSIDAILEYDAYVDDTTEAVIDVFREAKTTPADLTHTQIESDSVAVVGESYLTPLERSILPNGYKSVDLFKSEPFEYPPFQIFQSSADLVRAIVNTVDRERADRVATVLDRGSRYASLVEAAFDSQDIPHYGGPGFRDDPHHRCFLRLCRLAFRGDAVLLADIAPIADQLGIPIAYDRMNERLFTGNAPNPQRDSETDNESPINEWLANFCKNVPTQTFDNALSAYETQAGSRLVSLRNEFETLGMLDSPVGKDTISAFEFYTQTYEIPVEREKEGVLLADGSSSAYVDRPVVFFVGLGDGWANVAPRRPWVDATDQFRRARSQFQLLLQSGDTQYYLVEDTRGGRPVQPCPFFNDLLEEPFERFSDLRSATRRLPVETRGQAFEREPLDGSVEPIDPLDTISNSQLQTFVNCPRDYLFDRLLETPESEPLRRGSLLHDFAELYVYHPEMVEEVGLETIAEWLCDQIEPLCAGVDRPLQRGKFLVGLETIVTFLETHELPDQIEFPESDSWGTNALAQEYNREVDGQISEYWFDDPGLGMNGKIDLVLAADHLVDFKSGSRKNGKEVLENAAIDPPSDTPDFQIVMYLAFARAHKADAELDFSFVHVLEPLEDRTTGEWELAETMTTVRYYPWSFDDHVSTRAAYDDLLDGYNDCVETVEDLGFAGYQEIVEPLPFPETSDVSELRESRFAREFTTDVVEETDESVNAEKGCDQIVRKLNDLRKQTLFREDLDAFEQFVADQLTDLNWYREGNDRFPIEGVCVGSGDYPDDTFSHSPDDTPGHGPDDSSDGRPRKEPNYRRVDNRDLLLSGDSGGSGDNGGNHE